MNEEHPIMPNSRLRLVARFDPVDQILTGTVVDEQDRVIASVCAPPPDPHPRNLIIIPVRSSPYESFLRAVLLHPRNITYLNRLMGIEADEEEFVTEHPLCSVKEACEIINCCRKTLYNYTRKGLIKAVRSPGRCRYTVEDIQDFIRKYRS